MANLDVVQEIYAAFGRGDVPGILKHLADDVDWEYGYRANPSPVPWLRAGTGHAGASEFFMNLMTGLDMRGFRVNGLAEGPNLVIAIVDVDAVVRSTGQPIEERDEAHVWHFGADGKVARFRHCADTWQHAVASGLAAPAQAAAH